jgi:hypothetical protein
MKKIFKISLLLAVILVAQACSLDPVVDPNFPSVDAVKENASKAQLDALIIGQIAASRNGLATYRQVVGTIGKELFNFNGTESRWMTELNGLRPIDNSAFYNGATTAFGLPVRNANIILASLEKTSSVSEEQKNAYRGVANTFKGLAYLCMLNAQYQNGVRLNVEDPFNPSKPASYTESLAGIEGFLNTGATQLDAAGATFPFNFPFAPSIASFRQFNRAIALRLAIYQAQWSKAEALIPQTFISEDATALTFLTAGFYHTFSPTAPDIANPLVSTSSQVIVGVEKLWDDAEAGDLRKKKVLDLLNDGDDKTMPLTYTSGVTYTTKYRVNMYNAADAPAPVIRNEELLLIAAEVAAQLNKPTDAVKYINLVRIANGLPAYTGAQTQTALVDAILKERLYSLFYEGHRWVDMRRYNKLAQIELPVTGMVVLQQLERPVAEVNWDNANP